MKIRMGDQEKEHEGFSCPAKAHQGWCYRDDCVGAVCQGMKEVGYGGALLPGTGLVIRTDPSVPADEIRFVRPEFPRLRYESSQGVWITEREPEATNVDVFRHAAAIRARIVAALEAEIGDRATAERLAGVVVKALEEGA